MIKRIVVAETQVPFVRGGAELHVAALIAQLQRRGYEAGCASRVVTKPFSSA